MRYGGAESFEFSKLCTDYTRRVNKCSDSARWIRVQDADLRNDWTVLWARRVLRFAAGVGNGVLHGA